MEYLQHPEILALLKASYEYGNREAHLALLTMYATGARISQIVGDRHAKRPIEGLKGVDIIPDAETGGHRIRILRALFPKSCARYARPRGPREPAWHILSVRRPDSPLHARANEALCGERWTPRRYDPLPRDPPRCRYARLRAHSADRRCLWLPRPF